MVGGAGKLLTYFQFSGTVSRENKRRSRNMSGHFIQEACFDFPFLFENKAA